MRNRKRLLWLAFILLAVIVVALGQALLRPGARGDESAINHSEEADRGAALLASGTIRADEVRVAAELGGRIVEMPVAAGDSVKSGQTLVRLDATQLEAALLEQAAAVAVAEADLAEAQAGPSPEAIAASRAAVAIARAQRDRARAAWESALAAVEDPQELDAAIVDARTQVKLAEQSLELAEAQLAQEQLLRDQRETGTLERQVADLQVRARDEALATAEAELSAAQAMLNGLYAIRSQPLALLAQANLAEGEFRLAQAALDVARERLADLLDGPMAEEIAVARAAVTLAQAQAGVIAANEEKFRLTAPIDGLVLSQDARPGEVVAPAAPILTLADLKQVILVVYVPSDRIGQVHLGRSVQVTVDSFPGRVFAGQVSRIGAEPEFTPRNVATAEERANTFYQVEIRLSNPEMELKPGMPADALFVVEEA